MKTILGLLLLCISACVLWLATRGPLGKEASIQASGYAYVSGTPPSHSTDLSNNTKTVSSGMARQTAYSNSVTTLLTASYSWWLGGKPLPLDELGGQELTAYQERAFETVSNVVTSDIAVGVNDQVRAREQNLRDLAAQLSIGSTLTEAVSLIGRPDIVDLIVIKRAREDGHIGGIQTFEVCRTNSVAGVAFEDEAIIAISYWPRVGLPFDGSNGQGYRVLYLVFDQARILRSIFWEQPSPLIRGRIGPDPKDTDYWSGKFKKSPPPLNMVWQ